MSFNPDPRVELAKSRTMAEVVALLDVPNLVRISGELTGPCPSCGGRDRFSININKGVYNCRSCGSGDALALVQLFYGCDFMGAVEILEGERAAEVDPAELERRKKKKAEADEKAEAYAAKMKAYAYRDARRIWDAAQPFRGTVAEAYLAARGVDLARLPYSFACLRFLPAHPYAKKIDGAFSRLHVGPCLIAAIQGRDDRFSAVHQTWIDPARPGEKALIRHPSGGDPLPAKMVRGSKKGGAIRLTGTACAGALVMGEGIETTATALVGDAVIGAAYWVGVDLGNLGGKQVGRNSGIPDLGDLEAFVPPAQVSRLIFIQDGDSEENMTRAKLTAGLRRAMKSNPHLRGHIVRAGAGVDLNDLVKGQK